MRALPFDSTARLRAGLLLAATALGACAAPASGDAPAVARDAATAAARPSAQTPATLEGPAATRTRPAAPQVAVPRAAAPQAAAPQAAAWTVLVHFSGTEAQSVDTLADLAELAGALPLLDLRVGALGAPLALRPLHVLAQVETAPSAPGELPEVARYVVTSTSIERVGGPDASAGDSTRAGEPGPLRDGDASARVADFVSWGIERFPALRVAVVFRDLGGGWSTAALPAFARDGRPVAALDAERAALGLDVGLQLVGRHSVDLVGLDLSLGATLENAFVFAPVARVLVASQERSPAGGWAYDRALGALAGEPLRDALGAGELFADALFQALEDESAAVAAASTVSVLDLAELRPVAGAVAALGGWLGGELDAEGRAAWLRLARVRRGAQSFGADPGEPAYDAGLVDLWDLADRVAAATASPELRAFGQTLAEALPRAVLYELHGAARPAARGLSIRFPALAATEAASGGAYRATAWSRATPLWAELIERFHDRALRDVAAPEMAESKLALLPDGTLRVEGATEGADVAEVWLELYRPSLDGTRFHRVLALPIDAADGGPVQVDYPLMAFALSDGERAVAAAALPDPLGWTAFTQGAATHFTAWLPAEVGGRRALLAFDGAATDDGALAFTFAGAWETGAVTRAVVLAPGAEVLPLTRVATDEGFAWERTPDATPLVVGDVDTTPLRLVPASLRAGEQIAAGLTARDEAGNEAAAFDGLFVPGEAPDAAPVP